MSNATDPNAATGTANVPVDGVVQEQGGQPPADGVGAEGQATEGEGTPSDDAGKPPATDPQTPPEGEAQGEEAQGAPEAYEPFTLPEGITLADEDLSSLTEFGKRHNLSQAAAQEALDLATSHVQRLQDGYVKESSERIEQWAQQAKTDPLVGGTGYDANVKVAQSAIAKFGDTELTALFEEYGLGNHPAVVRFAYRIGKAAGESGFVHGQGQEQPAKAANPEIALANRIKAEQARNRPA